MDKATHERLDPAHDWIYQLELAAQLGISPQTASAWAKAGRLRRYEHGVENCGRRRYSRWLVERERQRRLQQAVEYQDSLLAGGV
jgi:predicted site-specific integrase-resolvase